MSDLPIESQINQLKDLIHKYDKLDDLEKMNNINQYNEAKEKYTLCKLQLDEYASIIESIQEVDNISESEVSVNDIMKEINLIKEQIDNNLKLNELIDLYSKLIKLKTILQSYLENKKMTIINVE